MKRCFYLFGLLFYINAQAQSIESMMEEYNQKNALSQKTVDENKGHLVLYSREKLENMHARTLKDVFLTTPVVYYHENRFALPDPLTSGAFEPYRSNFIRLYIDGVEITQGWLGSGLVLYGDMDIDFVDHIEFYYMIPSFETSVEPAYLTIFLYSKDPKRDSGGKFGLRGGSRGYNDQRFSCAQQVNDLSYMVNFSHTKDKREKIANGTSHPLSRDFERTQLFSSIKTEKQSFHLQVMKKNTDALAGYSVDATPEESRVDYLNIHMDYGIDLDEHWHAQFAYDWLKSSIYMLDDHQLAYLALFSPYTTQLDGKITNSTYTGELTYNQTIGKHRISTGIKGRVKQLDRVKQNGFGDIPLDFDQEAIASLFFQDQYALGEGELLTFGVEGMHFARNGGVEDDDLVQIRLGYIWNNDQWTYKTYLYRLMFALDPYNRYIGGPLTRSVEPQKTIGITQELAYSTDQQRIRLMLLFMKDEEGLVQNVLDSGNTQYFFTVLNFEYDFSIDSKLTTQVYYADYRHIFSLDELEDFSGYFSLFNRCGKFDVYNGLVWHINSLDWKNYWDLTSSVSWNMDEDMTVTLKGENILDRAKETSLFRIDPSTTNMMQPLSISPVDRRIMIEWEYTF
ncbi:MAG: hypothetical protein IE885_07515 [Campylobacterales bacterium]|nr:hypothetical protein [Campylobacterales bacterium]